MPDTVPATPKTPRRGRPAGSKNKPRPTAAAEPTRCPQCGSTDRAKYERTTVTEHGGLSVDGKPYTHIVRRWTHCLACGQHRVDRALENRTAAKK